VERRPELGRADPVTRVLRKAQQQELGTVAEVKEVEHEAGHEAEHETEHEAEHETEHEAEHEATFEELKELLHGGGEAEREGSAVVESSLDGLEELDAASLPSLLLLDLQFCDLRGGPFLPIGRGSTSSPLLPLSIPAHPPSPSR